MAGEELLPGMHPNRPPSSSTDPVMRRRNAQGEVLIDARRVLAIHVLSFRITSIARVLLARPLGFRSESGLNLGSIDGPC